jgi:hypothetical protein
MGNKRNKYGFILLILLFFSQVSFSQNFKGGSGDGYEGSSTILTDLNSVSEFLSVNIEQAGAQMDPTNTLPIRFAVNFSQDAVDFTFDDIT